MRVWHISGLVAVVALLMLLGAALTSADGTAPPAREIGGTLAGMAICVVITAVSFVFESRSRRHERSGSVAPLPRGGTTAATASSRWALRDVAGAIAGERGEANPSVSADERSRTIRIVLDPPSWIQLNTSLTRNVRTDSSGRRIRHHRGRWIVVTLRPGRRPRLRLREGLMDARRLPDGRLGLLWGWRAGRGVQRTRTTETVLQEERSRPVSFSITSTEIAAHVDAIAVRAGWVTPEALQRRSAPDLRPATWSVSRGGSRPFSAPAGPQDASGAPGAPSSVHAAFDPAAHGVPDGDELRRAQWLVTQGVSAFSGFDRIARVAVWVAAAVLAACVIATVIGLLAGMVWWAGLIIIGSGVLFALILMLPLMMVSRTRSRRGTPGEHRE